MGIDVLATLKKLPEKCFSILPSNPCQLIGIHRGVPGYTPLKIHPTPEEARAQADRLNESSRCDKAQEEAMVMGSCFGWHVPGADPDSYR